MWPTLDQSGSSYVASRNYTIYKCTPETVQNRQERVFTDTIRFHMSVQSAQTSPELEPHIHKWCDAHAIVAYIGEVVNS